MKALLTIEGTLRHSSAISITSRDFVLRERSVGLTPQVTRDGSSLRSVEQVAPGEAGIQRDHLDERLGSLFGKVKAGEAGICEIPIIES